jgi:hypothetical protein
MKSPKLASDEPALRISKLERETLHDRAYLEVKKAIMSGAIRPGATITFAPWREAARAAIEVDITDAARIIREFLATPSSTAAG